MQFILKKIIVIAALVPDVGIVATVGPHQSQTYGCNPGGFYSFDWADTYKLDRKMPQGCTCADSQTADTDCNIFDCECTCDLAAGICDFGCCCDPDCSATEVARFSDSEEGCLLGENEPDFQACYAAHQVLRQLVCQP